MNRIPESEMSVLAMTDAELKLRYPNTDIKHEMIKEAEERVSQMDARDLPESNFIKTAFRLDDLLGGGFGSGRGVIEITGESSCGKTQLMLDIALSCRKKAIYIATEGRFPGERIAQLIKLRECWRDASLDNVLVSRVPDLESLILMVEHTLPAILKSQNIGVILIDSITWPFRVEDGSRQRTQQIQNVVRKLHQLSKTFNVAVVCVNHVADDPHNGESKPCLGQSWSKGISGRLFLRIEDRSTGLRSVTVDWCEDYLNWTTGVKRNFRIQAEGLVEVQ